MRDHRQVVEGVIYRYRCGLAWRDLPASFGPWQTVWKRHRRFSQDGTWDTIHRALLTRADADGQVEWTVSVDSTINRAHQHAINLPRERPAEEESETVPQDAAASALTEVLGQVRGGLNRITRILVRTGGRTCTRSRSITASVAPAEDCPARSTSSSTDAEDPWWCSSDQVRPTTPQSFPNSSVA